MYNYDAQIKELTANPRAISIHWSGGDGLFAFVGKSKYAGCLTMIRQQPEQYKAFINGKVDQHLTDKIAADERIPKQPSGITIENLDVFKEWQLRIYHLNNKQNNA